ncbi:hypothetical protein HMPREF9966_1144 [Streptococcus anginosus SK52 = DSM 20563]|nr:hypothetical protein HMPREF9966_1144 [Streptococcus anginosus SK52 = DSM 20563]BBD42722.1 hypothetical protein SA27298_1254 [Streptococcus anginosus]
MVPKLIKTSSNQGDSFRAVLFRMVPKLLSFCYNKSRSFRAVLFRMVPKHSSSKLDE